MGNYLDAAGPRLENPAPSGACYDGGPRPLGGISSTYFNRPNARLRALRYQGSASSNCYLRWCSHCEYGLQHCQGRGGEARSNGSSRTSSEIAFQYDLTSLYIRSAPANGARVPTKSSRPYVEG